MPKTQQPAYLRQPQRLANYILAERRYLLLVTLTGLIYNAGMTAGPYFEGQMTQCLVAIIGGQTVWSAMLTLALTYLGIILLVQGCRAGKRFFVRRFANNLSRNLRLVLYRCLLGQTPAERTGDLMTKAVGDVDICTEGVRKFTTELFDTGVVMVAYVTFLMAYDLRLTIYACLIIPVAYLIALAVKRQVAAANRRVRASEEQLTSATLDRLTHALTWRLVGYEARRNAVYEQSLTDYQQKSVRAGLWENALQPLYRIITVMGTLPIFYYGGAYVQSRYWDIAAFTAFFACYLRLAEKASHGAKLFNAVQKAQVSWQRVKPLLILPPKLPPREAAQKPLAFSLHDFGLTRGEKAIVKGLTLDLPAGSTVAVTGPVASGKSSLLQVLTQNLPYTGQLWAKQLPPKSVAASMKKIVLERLAGEAPATQEQIAEWRALPLGEQRKLVTGMPQAHSFFSGSIRENITLGKHFDIAPYLELVDLTKEIAALPSGADTQLLSDGSPLSGGQQQRLALARTLAHAGSVLVLDDPFASLDTATTQQIFTNLRHWQKGRTLIFSTQQLTLCPACDYILYLCQGEAIWGHFTEVCERSLAFARQYHEQAGGEQHD